MGDTISFMLKSAVGQILPAMFLTSGYAYDSAEQAAARMAGDEEGYVYSRYGNPTNQMLAERLALLEGAETCRVTASGMHGNGNAGRCQSLADRNAVIVMGMHPAFRYQADDMSRPTRSAFSLIAALMCPYPDPTASAAQRRPTRSD